MPVPLNTIYQDLMSKGYTYSQVADLLEDAWDSRRISFDRDGNVILRGTIV